MGPPAENGISSLIGEEDRGPSLPGAALGDTMTGAHALAAINGALFNRAMGGGGDHLDITLLDSYFHCHEMSVGVYSASNNMFQVEVTLVLGLVGLFLMWLGFHPAPMLLGFVLGPRVEENFRRAMLSAFGDPMEILMRPISGTLLVLSAIMLLLTFWTAIKQPAVKPPVLREE